MQTNIAFLGIPLMLLNWLGGIVSGIWLAILGQWWAIGYGVVGFFISTFIISIALAPGLALAGPGMALASRGKILASLPFLILNTIYTYGVITAWCMLVFYIFMRGANHATFIPLLIWSYGVATGPWAYMATREEQTGSGDTATLAAFFAQIAYVVVGIAAIVSNSSRQDLTELFAAVMGIAMVIQFLVTISILMNIWRFQKR